MGRARKRRHLPHKRDGDDAARGVIYTVAPSYKDVNTIWAGTDDGLIHVTRNGGTTWQNVTPPELKSWAKVSLIDAGRFDAKYGVCGDQHVSPRRPAAAHSSDARRRQDVEGDRQRPAKWRYRQFGSRRPGAKRSAVLRHRTGRLFLA